MQKPDPYGEWVAFTSRRDKKGSAFPLQEELFDAARAAWPQILAHVRREHPDGDQGLEKSALAADTWEQVLQSVSRTLNRQKGRRSQISNLQSYLSGAFHHRFKRVLKKERRRGETIQLVSSIEELERLPGAQSSQSVSEIERAITVKEVAAQMDEWTRRVWEARQVGYSWKEIASRLGQNEQRTKMKFRYGLEKTRQRLADLLPRLKPKALSKDDQD